MTIISRPFIWRTLFLWCTSQCPDRPTPRETLNNGELFRVALGCYLVSFCLSFFFSFSFCVSYSFSFSFYLWPSWPISNHLEQPWAFLCDLTNRFTCRWHLTSAMFGKSHYFHLTSISHPRNSSLTPLELISDLCSTHLELLSNSSRTHLDLIWNSSRRLDSTSFSSQYFCKLGRPTRTADKIQNWIDSEFEFLLSPRHFKAWLTCQTFLSFVNMSNISKLGWRVKDFRPFLTCQTLQTFQNISDILRNSQICSLPSPISSEYF